MIDKREALNAQAREQAGGLDLWATVLEAHNPEGSAKGILMLRAAAKTLRELADARDGAAPPTPEPEDPNYG